MQLMRNDDFVMTLRLRYFTWCLTLIALITTAADDIHKYFFHCFSEKIRLDVSSESSSKDKNKKIKCRLLQFLFGALRVKCCDVFRNSLRIMSTVANL